MESARSDRAEAENGEPSDHELVRSCQQGTERAFEILVRRHQARAMRVALSLVGKREDAEDVAQEAFLRVFRNLERFDFEHDFTTWLYRIVTNLSIDHLRRRRPAVSTSGTSENQGDLEFADVDAPQPHDRIESRETARLVRTCIERLAPHFSSVLVLRELEGLPCTEIARIVGATHVTVRWRLHRGRKLFQLEWEHMERARIAAEASNKTAAEGVGPAGIGSPSSKTP